MPASIAVGQEHGRTIPLADISLKRRGTAKWVVRSALSQARHAKGFGIPFSRVLQNPHRVLLDPNLRDFGCEAPERLKLLSGLIEFACKS